MRLPPPTPDPTPPATAALAWMLLGLAGLSVSAGFAVLLVLMRAPGLALLPRELFPATLALHVNLAVVVWFLSVAASLFAFHQRRRFLWIDHGSWGLSALGACALVGSAFAGGGGAYMNNYVPVLDDPLFGVGLAAFLAGVGLVAARTALEGPGRGLAEEGGPERAGVWVAAMTVLASFGAFAASWAGLPPGLEGAPRYEALFWAGGHLLQFTHTTLLFVVWFRLARASGVLREPRPAWHAAVFALTALPVLAAPLGYLDAVGGPEHRLFFTTLMRWGTWLALPLVAAILVKGWRSGGVRVGDAGRPLRVIVLLSAVLFACGLTVGAFIRYDGMLVTAHYHATVGAVTLAYFGWCRVLAGRVGLGVPGGRLATAQAALYGGGLLVLVVGLAVSGVTGLPRKTPDVQHPAIGGPQTAGLLLVGIGGFLALAALFLFLWATLSAWRRPPTPELGRSAEAAGRRR